MFEQALHTIVRHYETPTLAGSDSIDTEELNGDIMPRARRSSRRQQRHRQEASPH